MPYFFAKLIYSLYHAVTRKINPEDETMNLSTTYRINAPTVVGEVIDGEAIIIHLESGTYFSARDSAARIWELVEQGASVAQIIEVLASEYDKNALELSFNLAAFFAQLQSNHLIVEDSSAAPATLTVALVESKRPYSEPQLEIFRDMQNLLMLDPIHQVDTNIGWPAPLNGNG